MSDFEKFERELPSKEKFYSSLTGKKLVTKIMNIFLRFALNLKWKCYYEDYHELYLKYDVLLLSDIFAIFRINSLKNYS